jgi:DNA mismatch repair protein MutS
VKKLLYYIYNLDVYISVANVATARNFVFPEALETSLHTIRITNVYHPHLEGAVPNSITITPDSNIIFLTGANMAGKSTFMKSLGIALFLAHMGFPVAAEKMEFSVREGLFTTINLPDNLNLGYSHFYVEVLRVKKMAEFLRQGKNLFIIFDELFRGTNVKDAYEATVAITGAFAKKRNCMFIVSTHIMEAGDTLREMHKNIRFLYLPTKMNGTHPYYTYTLEEGITADRHGMIIINNEGILDILKKGLTETPVK